MFDDFLAELVREDQHPLLSKRWILDGRLLRDFRMASHGLVMMIGPGGGGKSHFDEDADFCIVGVGEDCDKSLPRWADSSGDQVSDMQ